ncbi:phage tailspike polysaccharide lyase family protein [Acinetobacter sp. PFS20]|uniref:phage tailspike polysaccharide lyase family protein n=1 Tax=Acinetobacter sp. PFS20 TaxID=3458434 RepID=UPI003FD5A05D
MAVADQTPYKEYVANGTTTIFPLEFDCDDAEHLIVKKDDEVIPSLNNWSLDTNTGSVVFSVAPYVGSKLILQRDTPLVRNTDYATYNNSIRPTPVNKDFDRIWLKLQELGIGDYLLKEFFLKEVENQGVAVGQLDELYNDFLQRLANVNTDKDWDAAFVAYRGSTQDIFNQNQENLNLTIINYVNPKMWGAIGNGVADDSNAIESCRNYMIANNATFNDFSESKYRHTRNITFTAPNQKLIFNGNCEFVSDSFYITFTGTKTQIGYISTAASKNSKTITLNQNISLNQNDLIAIHNSRVSSLSTHRSYYYDGEIREVESVSGNVITLKAQLESSYPSGVEDKVWKIEPINLEINGITFTGNGISAVKVSLAVKSSFNFNANNLQNNVGSQNAFYIDRCFDCHVKGGRYIKKGVSGTGTDYGILVSNSQDILIEADYAYGGRHGCAVGGDNNDMAIPNRRIYFEKIVIENDPTTTLHAADFHGNAIACYYKNCEIKGRVSLAGDSCKSIGNRITSPAGEVRSPIHLTEVIGGDVGSFGDTFLSTGIATTLMMWQTSTFLEKLSKPATFSMVDPIVEANNSLIGLMSILNTNQPCKYVLDGFAINGDVSTLNRLISYTTGTSAIKPVFIQITRPKTQLNETVVLLQGDVVLPNVAKSVFSQSGTDTVNNNGSWIKQSDGSMICRQRISVTGTINTAYAGGYKSADITWTYPKAFVGVPTIIATSLDNACASIKALNPTSTATTLFGFATQSFASASVVIDVTAIGRHLT